MEKLIEYIRKSERYKRIVCNGIIYETDGTCLLRTGFTFEKNSERYVSMPPFSGQIAIGKFEEMFEEDTEEISTSFEIPAEAPFARFDVVDYDGYKFGALCDNDYILLIDEIHCVQFGRISWRTSTYFLKINNNAIIHAVKSLA